MKSGPVSIQLSADEGLVLFDLLAEFIQEGRFVAPAEDSAEWMALSAVLGGLEEQLAEPLSPDYADLLSSARERLKPRR